MSSTVEEELGEKTHRIYTPAPVKLKLTKCKILQVFSRKYMLIHDPFSCQLHVSLKYPGVEWLVHGSRV